MAEIEKYDPSKLMEMVRDRIRATFVSLIPDEQWDNMIKKEIDIFFAEHEVGYRNYDEKVSDFRKVVFDELGKKCKEKVIKCLDELSVYDWDKGKVNEKVEKMIVENAGTIVSSLIGNAIQNNINNLKNLM